MPTESLRRPVEYRRRRTRGRPKVPSRPRPDDAPRADEVLGSPEREPEEVEVGRRGETRHCVGNVRILLTLLVTSQKYS